ncbi:MAG TPA: Rieske (2Fe-2S) protein [Pyrinomonadaceae bacterium]|jgi:Rieske Fe-S protein
MTERDETTSGAQADAGRRRLLLFIPAAVGLSILTTLAAAAARYLRPQPEQAAQGDEWLPVAPVAELTGTQPSAHSVGVRHALGWSEVVEEHPLFVLPGAEGPRVLSAVCPHEGCTVVWRAETGDFLCPCHDSHFDQTGARTDGPAARGLEQLSTQVTGGVLKVRLATPPPEAGQQPPVRA